MRGGKWRTVGTNKEDEMKRILIIGLLLTWTSVGYGGHEFEIDSLKGLNGVIVLIEDLKQETESDGLTKRHLQTDVERRLGKAGIPVLEDADPYLYLYVNIQDFKMEHDHYVFNIEVALKQMVWLARDTSIFTVGATWETNHLGITPTDKMPEAIGGKVADLVDEFITDYRMANAIERTE